MGVIVVVDWSVVCALLCLLYFFFSSRRRHTRCALVTGVQTCALPISMFLMSRNYTLYAMLPRDEDRPAALVMPGSGVYHLEHAPTWMPNVATYLTRIDPRNIDRKSTRLNSSH